MWRWLGVLSGSCLLLGCKQPLHSSTERNKPQAQHRATKTLVMRRPASQRAAAKLSTRQARRSARPGSSKHPRPRYRRIRPKPPAPPWYRPKYRERHFAPPQIRLLRVPNIRPIPPTVIHQGPKTGKKVALTFDACSWNSHPRFDRRIANILIRTRTPATIFMGGLWVLKRQQDARWLASIPFFEIANHSYKHGHLTKVSQQRLERELRWTQEIIYTILKRVPNLFRPPFFETNRRVEAVAGKLGLKTIMGLASGDPDPTFTKRVLVRYLKRKVRAGSIIVMHINKGGKHTAEALPEIIHVLKQKGFQFVTVGNLLSDKNK